MHNIIFTPGSKEIHENVPPPEPASALIPSWYKKIPGGPNIQNVKKCIPFLDSMINGYIQKTWSDIYVENTNGVLSVRQKDGEPIVGSRRSTDMPISTDFYNTELLWKRPWAITLPENFSALLVHPLNRIDLPFVTMSGIVDFDKTIPAPIGNIPFFIKNGFTGIIPKGTPMFQIIPFKRFEWSSQINNYDVEFWKEKAKHRKGPTSLYKKNIWQRKKFD